MLHSKVPAISFFLVFASFRLVLAVDVHHATLGEHVTYDLATSYCDRQAMRLCSSEEVCNDDNPPVVGVLDGDNWAPISDAYNDWIQIGRDRLCYKHIEHYGAPAWGLTTGRCGNQLPAGQICPIKKHVFCCAGAKLDGGFVTYDTARSYCLERGKDLCRHNQICNDQNQVTAMNVAQGDFWSPIRDKYNDWTQVGNDGGRTCWRHIQHHGYPTWGTTIGDCTPWYPAGEPCRVKKFVFCCDSSDPETEPTPFDYNIFHFIMEPSTMTWSLAQQFCRAQPGRDLCSADEICPAGIPLLTGVLQGDNWTPIRDQNSAEVNDWIEIGNDNNPERFAKRVCFTHNQHYGATSWGDTTGACPPWTTSDGICPHKRHVFCCSPKNKCF